MFELLSVCSNFSMASRINKYVGVTHQEIITENKPVKKDYSRWKNSLSLLFWILLFAGSIAGVACVCIFAKIHVLTVILLICWLLVSLAFLLIGIVNFTRTVTVGNLRYGRAEEII